MKIEPGQFVVWDRQIGDWWVATVVRITPRGRVTLVVEEPGWPTRTVTTAPWKLHPNASPWPAC